MDLQKAFSPHIRDKVSISMIMWIVVAALMPASISAVYHFGLTALWLMLYGVGSAVLFEALIQFFTGQKIRVADGSAVLTGLLLSMALPPATPVFVIVMGSFFAIAIGKMSFGGLGNNIFNPALVGRAFVVASWPNLTSGWIAPDGITTATPLGALKFSGSAVATKMEMFLGNTGGCIGETSALALMIGGLILILLRIIDWRIPLAYIGTVFMLMFASGQDPLFHILGGGLMIGAFFMATDYVTSPLTSKGRVIFGFGCGLVVVIIRLFGGLPEGVMYSILLMNAFTPLIDRYTKHKPFGCKVR